jgi:histidinol dehydrogenase
MKPFPVYRNDELAGAAREELMARSSAAVFDRALNESVSEILADVREHGDEALLRALEQHDGVRCTAGELRVGADEIEAAHGAIPEAVADAIRIGIQNIRRYNERILEEASWRAELEAGLVVGEQARPIASAGLFVPSGKGSFPSVLMHLGTPAVVAGVSEVVVVVPPRPGSLEVDPAVLFVAGELGLEQVFRSNGPAGIAALAFGTETIPRVTRVVGPGSPAVVAAQVQVQLAGCATILLFGPSESLIVADENADPILLAADFLTEAEHGPDSACLLVTPSEGLVDRVGDEVTRALRELPQPRRDWAGQALARGGVILVSDLDEAVDFANEYAPEHLQLAVRAPESLAESVEHAGEILLGQVPFAAANYLLGIPNTLPTGGFARVSSGVTVRAFLKASSVALAQEPALGRLLHASAALAEHEGFAAHSRALQLRATQRFKTVEVPDV